MIQFLSMVPVRAWIAAGIVAAAALGLAASHWYAYKAGQKAQAGKQDAELVRALVGQMRRAQAAEVDAELAKAALMNEKARALAQIEAAANGTKERIRTIYRDRPVPAECQRPDGVREELQGAIARANAAARGL